MKNKKELIIAESGIKLWNPTAKTYVTLTDNNAIFHEDKLYMTQTKYDYYVSERTKSNLVGMQ